MYWDEKAWVWILRSRGDCIADSKAENVRLGREGMG